MPSPVWQNGTTLAGSAPAVGSAIVTLPSGIQANDIVIVTVYKENVEAITPPAGFTEKTGTGVPPVVGTQQGQYTFWKRMAGGESGTVTFSWTTGSVYRAATADRISGCITSGDPVEAIAGANSNTSTTAQPAVSLAATSPNSLLYHAAGNFLGGDSQTAAPSGFTEREDLTDVLANSTKDNTAGGATGSLSGTWNLAATGQTAVVLNLLGALASAPNPTMVASDKWFSRYKRNRKTKPKWLDIPAPQPTQQPPAFPPYQPRTRVPLPAFYGAMRMNADPIPITSLAGQPTRQRRPAATRPARRIQLPLVVSAPVVAQPVFAAPRIHVVALSRQTRRQQTMPLRLQVSGPPPAIPSVGSRARWAELRRRPRATEPLYLQLSGPPPALSKTRSARQAFPQARRTRLQAPPTSLVLPGRPARRFVAALPRPVRRQLSLLPPVPFFGRRISVPIPRFGKRQAQLAPPVITIVAPAVPPAGLPRKVSWFGLRQRRAPALQITGAAPPVAVAPPAAPPPKPRLSGFRPKRTMPRRPFFPVLLVNDAEEGTNGVTVSAANSGGVGENAFDNVVINGGSTLTFDNTNVAHGALAFKVQTSAAGETSTARWIASMGPQQQTWFRVYCYLPATGASWRVYGARCGAATSAGSVLINNVGVLSIQDTTFGNTISFTIHPNVGSWFRLEGYIIGHPTQGQISVSLFNNPEGVIPHETRTTTVGYNTFGNTNEYWFGQSATAGASGPFWMDDIGISNTGPLGPVGQESIIPAWLRSRAFPSILGLRLRRARPGPVVAGAVPPARGSLARRGAAPRPQPRAQRISGVPAPPGQAPARRRFGPLRLRRPSGLVQPPAAKPPPPGRAGSRARLTAFFRAVRKLARQITGAPPPSSFPGFVHITNRQVEPVIITNSAASVAISDRAVGGTVAIGNAAGAVTITNEEVWDVDVENL